MSFATFSGPVRFGTQRDAGATRNTGLPVLTRSYTVAFGVVATSPTAQTMMVLPAGSKILGATWETTTAFAGGGITAIGFTIGLLGGTANLYWTSTALAALTAGKAVAATADAAQQVAQTNNNPRR